MEVTNSKSTIAIVESTISIPGGKSSGDLLMLPHPSQKFYDLEINAPNFCKINRKLDKFNNQHLLFSSESKEDYEIFIKYKVELSNVFNDKLGDFRSSSTYVKVEKFPKMENAIIEGLKSIKSKMKYLKEDNVKSGYFSLTRGYGVCVNFAHAYIGILRASNIPARIVVGIPPIDTNEAHAWVEAYYSGKWIAIDPTIGAIGVKYIKWAIGMDEHDTRSIIKSNKREFEFSHYHKVLIKDN
ncbi:transglutaminase domain-containing protein [Acidianus sulfidivorans]|nr:transglutaminase domain-containing protein [Acidianus sulfidivorans]